MARPENPSPLSARLKQVITRKYPNNSIREVASMIRMPEPQMSDTVGGRDIRVSTLWRIGVLLGFTGEDWDEIFKAPESDYEMDYMTSPKASGGSELGAKGGVVTARINKAKAQERAAKKAQAK